MIDARHIIGLILKDSADTIRKYFSSMFNPVTSYSVDIEFNDEYYLEVSMKLIKKL